MFLRNLKSIYLSAKKRDIQSSSIYADNLLQIMQSGGSALEKILKNDIEPKIQQLHIQKNNIEILLQIVNYLIEYVEKLNVPDSETLLTTLAEMGKILRVRLEKDDL